MWKVVKYPLNPHQEIWYSSTTHTNQTIDVRGPYTVDSALENEYTSIRMPSEALATLELNYGDSIYINNQKYILNETGQVKIIPCGYPMLPEV